MPRQGRTFANLRKRIGIVLQDFRLLGPHDDLRERGAAVSASSAGTNRANRKEVIDLLKWVGLGERMDSLPPILSGGEKQARGDRARRDLAGRNCCWADEPTGNVDPTLGRRLLRLFIELNKIPAPR